MIENILLLGMLILFFGLIIGLLLLVCYKCVQISQVDKDKQFGMKFINSDKVKGKIKDKVKDLGEVKVEIVHKGEEGSVTPIIKKSSIVVNDTFIYILKLEQGKFYIGKSKNPEERYRHHCEGNGSEWTKLYKPIEIISVLPCEYLFDEDKYTLEYMLLYGIENVRGGNYSKITLEEMDINYINKLFNGVKDGCYKCGDTSHFIKDCPLNKPLCYRCGIFGHYAASCTALKKDYLCFKCKQPGHFSSSCHIRR